MKTCTKCGETKGFTEFYKDPRPNIDYRAACKTCIVKSTTARTSTRRKEDPEHMHAIDRKHNQNRKEYHAQWQRDNRDRLNARQRERYAQGVGTDRWAKRQAVLLGAMPKWADKEEINYIYSLASEKGLQVDHIVPLRSDKVCGLHTGDNMRCIPAELNRKKSNHYWSDMWEEL